MSSPPPANDPLAAALARHRSPAGLVGAMECATVGVSDLDAALRLFADTMRLRVDTRYSAGAELMRAWGLDAGAHAEVVELSLAGYPFGRLRLVAYSPPARTVVRLDAGPDAPDAPADVGPKAIDFYVGAPIQDAVDAMARAGFPARSAPVYHQIGDTISEELLFTGPDGLPILLMVGHRHSEKSMRRGPPQGPFSEIPTVSIVCADLESTRTYYRDLLGLIAVNDNETPDQYRDLVDDLVGMPQGTRVHFLLMAQPGEASGKILLVHFFERTGRRLIGRMRPGHLGLSLLTHRCRDLDALAAALRAAGYPPHFGPDFVRYGERRERVLIAPGPNEECFEFVQL
jgi:catechol 2,3-dioxygenase-like lactoylglutathione lyase family enzyme